MPDFVYKRVVHVAEYYRITAKDEAEGQQMLEARLDSLTEGLAAFQDEYYPADRTESLAGNEDVALVDSLPSDDDEEDSSESIDTGHHEGGR